MNFGPTNSSNIILMTLHELLPPNLHAFFSQLMKGHVLIVRENYNKAVSRRLHSSVNSPGIICDLSFLMLRFGLFLPTLFLKKNARLFNYIL